MIVKFVRSALLNRLRMKKEAEYDDKIKQQLSAEKQLKILYN